MWGTGGGGRSTRKRSRGQLSLVALTFVGAASLAKGACPNLCNGHGECNIYSRCECWSEWQGGDCSERICPYGLAWADESTADDTAHANAECSNRGICDRDTGTCSCMGGFTGSACQRLECSDDCNERGRCFTMSAFAEWTYDDESDQYAYDAVWDAEKIQGCDCHYPYYGYGCTQIECPTGDDPLTTGQVNEVQIFKCEATSGSFVLYWEGEATENIRVGMTSAQVEAAIETHSRIPEVDVTFSVYNGSVCMTSEVNVVTIEFLQNFGDLAPLKPITSLSAGGTITLYTDGERSLVDSNGVSYNSIEGTKEGTYCSDRGLCIPSTGDGGDGSCECYTSNGDEYGSSDGYGSAGTRGDCGYAVGTISACPGDTACSGHGVCITDDSEYRCECSDGWFGGDCSQRTCPEGLAWFNYPSADETAHDELAECSMGGTCDRAAGTCSCDDAFTGAACEVMTCGGGAADPCNGYGKCMSMAELALNSYDNGVLTPYEYGTDPNNPYTWDAYRIYGCQCDEGYEGYDCSLRSCPTGDDPNTYDQYNELQLLTCEALGGSFTLTFREETTDRILWNATATELLAYLEALDSINFLGSVKYSDGDTLCTDGTTDNVIQIQFQTEHSDLPDLEFDADDLEDSAGTAGGGTMTLYSDGDSVSGYTSVTGNTEDDVCSNRGLCDLTTGKCSCFTGYYSSNGAGDEGPIPDCGYQARLITTS